MSIYISLLFHTLSCRNVLLLLLLLLLFTVLAYKVGSSNDLRNLVCVASFLLPLPLCFITQILLQKDKLCFFVFVTPKIWNFFILFHL